MSSVHLQAPTLLPSLSTPHFWCPLFLGPFITSISLFLSTLCTTQPSLVMSTETPKVQLLTSTNWNQWELDMSFWLRFKGWWGYVSGRIVEPSVEDGL